jgi:hypothetical protein
MYTLGACQCAGCRKAMDRKFWDLMLDTGIKFWAIPTDVIDGEAIEVTAAYELGKADGLAGSTWLLEGNNAEQAKFLLRGLLDGDPLVLDSLPDSPLSGEWADSRTATSVLNDLGISPDDEAADDHLREYCDGYSDGMQRGAEREARRSLGIPENEADPIMWLQYHDEDN